MRTKTILALLILMLAIPMASADARDLFSRVRGGAPVAQPVIDDAATVVIVEDDVEVDPIVEEPLAEEEIQDDAEGEDHVRPQITPFVRVARFLQLDEGQREAWRALLETRAATIRPLKADLAEVRAELKAFIEDPSADPAVGGELVLEAAELKTAIVGAHRLYVEDFELLLSTEQMNRLRAMRAAGKLQPLLPAFRTTGLVAPR